MKLDDISMYDFIDIYCGNYNRLSMEKDAKDVAANLIFEYRMITDPAGSKSVIYSHGNRLKIKAKVLLFQICSNLLAMKSNKDVCRILNDYGYKGLNEDNVGLKVKSLLNSALYENKRLEDEPYASKKFTESDIRAYFNKEIAFLMTYFKMPIDIKSITASVYANIVNQAIEQIKNIKRK